MVGIYKITSPSGKVYIGQTWNTSKRFSRYRIGDISGQPKIHASFKSYGAASHKIEVIHELPSDIEQEVMNNYEIIYIQLYKDAGFELMNLNEGGRNCRPSDETKEKMSNKSKGIPLHIRIGEDAANRQKQRMSKAKKGVPHTKEHTAKIVAALTGKIPSKSHRDNISKSNIGRSVWNKGLKGFYKASEETKRRQSEARKIYLLTNPVTGICAKYVNK